MRQLFFTICLCLVTLAGLSQNQLISLDRIAYHSDLEKTTFASLQEGHAQQYFALLIAADQEASKDFCTSKYDLYQNTLNSIKSSKFDRKSAEKKIKEVYKTLHASFLRKYELKNNFSSIFRQGLYNCVSATALYALALDALGIDYTIHETPTHVYLVAYPQNERVLIESTDPAGGYYAFDDRFKNEFITQMRKHKLISSQEFDAQGTNQLFDQHFFADENITLKQLVGLQYCNNALYGMEEQQYEYAQQQLEKAYFLYPSERIGYLLEAATAHCLSETNTSVPRYGEYFVRIARYRNYAVEKEDIIQEFRRFTYEQLTQTYHVSHYDSTFHHITRHLPDSSLVREISHVYFQEKGRIEYNKGHYAAALTLLESACQLQPENVDNQSMMVSAIAQKLNTLSDINQRVGLIEEYTDRLPFLGKNTIMQGQLLQLYLMKFAQAYETGKEEEAQEFLQKFETKMQHRQQDLTVSADLIGRAYSVAAVYYFKKGNERETKRLLNKGLEYAPNHYELMQRKRMLGY